MDQYKCPCGYIYDPATGDPDHGVAPGTPWEAVPADWVCPICGLEKETFEKVGEQETEERSRTSLLCFFAAIGK